MKNVLPDFKSLLISILKKEIWVVLFFSLFVNHFTQTENFPLDPDYQFPLFSIGFTLVIGILIVLTAKLTFTFFKERFFSQKVDLRHILLFGGSVLALITLLYIPAYFLSEYFHEDTPDLYNFLVGLFLTLLLSSLYLVLGFSQSIYNLHKWSVLEGKLKIEKAGIISFIDYAEISYFFSLEKIVYLVKVDGSNVMTDFTLGQLESILPAQSFFRINRKIISHAQAITEVVGIENGKLSLQIQPSNFEKEMSPIIVSRYKKQAFQAWLNRAQK